MSDEMREKVRDIIANTAIGIPFGDLMEHKPEWLRLRGTKNGQWRDVNDPHQCDVTEAADAILSLIASELERVERERDEAREEAHVEWRRARQFALEVELYSLQSVNAKARATAAEARLAEAVEVIGKAIRVLSDAEVNEFSRLLDARDILVLSRAFMEQQG